MKHKPRSKKRTQTAVVPEKPIQKMKINNFEESLISVYFLLHVIEQQNTNEPFQMVMDYTPGKEKIKGIITQEGETLLNFSFDAEGFIKGIKDATKLMEAMNKEMKKKEFQMEITYNSELPTEIKFNSI